MFGSAAHLVVLTHWFEARSLPILVSPSMMASRTATSAGMRWCTRTAATAGVSRTLSGLIDAIGPTQKEIRTIFGALAAMRLQTVRV